jgi:hypothetical protein
MMRKSASAIRGSVQVVLKVGFRAAESTAAMSFRSENAELRDHCKKLGRLLRALLPSSSTR